MKKFIVSGKLSNVGYNIFATEESKKPINLDSLSPNNARIVRCVALINYVVNYNNKQCDFYRRKENQVVNALINLFDTNSKIQPNAILKYFGIKPQDKGEVNAINGLLDDICKDINRSSNLYHASYIYFKQQHNIDADVNCK